MSDYTPDSETAADRVKHAIQRLEDVADVVEFDGDSDAAGCIRQVIAEMKMPKEQFLRLLEIYKESSNV